MQFYDELSVHYDQMISFETRVENEQKIYKNILELYPAKNIIDAGCGSGFHSIILSSLGTCITEVYPNSLVNAGIISFLYFILRFGI